MRSEVDLPQPDGPYEYEALAVLDLEVEAVDGGAVRSGVEPGGSLEGDAGHGLPFVVAGRG